MMVIEKRNIEQPFQLVSGTPSFPLGAIETLLLSEHYFRKGNLAAALEHCQAALKLSPDDHEIKVALKRLQAAATT